jgi:hypothetical protein
MHHGCSRSEVWWESSQCHLHSSNRHDRGGHFPHLSVKWSFHCSPSLWGRMSLLLGRNWQKALQVVDQNEVECYIGENSRRHIFQVGGGAAAGMQHFKQSCTSQVFSLSVAVDIKQPALFPADASMQHCCAHSCRLHSIVQFIQCMRYARGPG